MSTPKDKEREVLNLHLDSKEFEINEGVGNIIRYHGSDIDLRKIPRAQAEVIAKDPAARYLRFSETKRQEVLKEAQDAAAAKAKVVKS